MTAAQHPYAAAPLPRCSFQIRDSAVLQPKRTVAHDHQIEHPEVPRGREQRLGRCGEPEAVNHGGGQRPRMPAHQEVWAHGMVSPSRAATKVGCGTFSGSHHPNARAAVRWVNAAPDGSSRLQAARSPLLVLGALGTYRPRDSRVQPALRCRPSTGVVTSGVCGERAIRAGEAGALWMRTAELHHPELSGCDGPKAQPAVATQQFRRIEGVSPPDIALDTELCWWPEISRYARVRVCCSSVPLSR